MTDDLHSLGSKGDMDSDNSKLTVSDIESFLDELWVPRACDLCHGKLEVMKAFMPPSDGQGVTVDESRPALAQLMVHEFQLNENENAEFRSFAYTLGCNRCGNARRMMVGPIHAWLKKNQPERYSHG